MIVVITFRELVGLAVLASIGIAYLIAWALDKRNQRNKKP